MGLADADLLDLGCHLGPRIHNGDDSGFVAKRE
jgi:hypothetical protein